MSGSRRPWLTAAKAGLVACGAATAVVVMTGALASPGPPAPATPPVPAASQGSVVRILPGTSLTTVRRISHDMIRSRTYPNLYAAVPIGCLSPWHT